MEQVQIVAKPTKIELVIPINVDYDWFCNTIRLSLDVDESSSIEDVIVSDIMAHHEKGIVIANKANYTRLLARAKADVISLETKLGIKHTPDRPSRPSMMNKFRGTQ